MLVYSPTWNLEFCVFSGKFKFPFPEFTCKEYVSSTYKHISTLTHNYNTGYTNYVAAIGETSSGCEYQLCWTLVEGWNCTNGIVSYRNLLTLTHTS